MYLGTGSLHVLFHLSKLQLATFKLLNISLWHINKINCQELGKVAAENFSSQIADAQNITFFRSRLLRAASRF